MIIKGRMGGVLVTLVNVFAPPGTDRSFFNRLFDLTVSECEGVLVCSGDWNTVLNHQLDTTSTSRLGSLKSKKLNIQIREAGLIEVFIQGTENSPTIQLHTKFTPGWTFS